MYLTKINCELLIPLSAF